MPFEKQIGGIVTKLFGRFFAEEAAFGIQFGKNANQNYHALWHLEEVGLNSKAIEAVKEAIKNDVSAIANQITTGAKVTSRSLNVNGVNVTYNAFKLPNGIINVGRITVP